jgi:hypothetical protein
MTGRPKVSVTGAALLVLLAVLSSLLAVPPAQAAGTLGTLTFDPAAGTDTTRPFVATHSAGGGTGCPVGTTAIRAVINGPAPQWDGKDFVILSKTANGLSTTADFSVQLGDNFLNTANANSVTIVAGRYDVTLFCQNNLGTTTFGTYEGSIWFTSPTAYQATDPGAGGPVGTTTTLTASPPGSSTPGAPVTLTATVNPGTATGSVQFRDGTGAGAAPIGAPVEVSGGTASTTTSSLAAGSHELVAVFTPTDPDGFQESTSAVVSHQVSAALPDLGTLTFDPATGLAVNAPYLNTHSTGASPGCPSVATNVSATVTGPGPWTDGFVALSNTANGVSSTTDMQLRLVDTWSGISAANSAPIVAGRYDVVLVCRDRLDQHRYGQFTGSVWFTDPTHYQSTDPATSATVTTTELSVSPTAVALSGAQVTLTAGVTPATAVGGVQFADLVLGTSVPLGSPVPVIGGAAALTVSTLDRGLHSLTATFVPTASDRFVGSVSDPITYVVALPPPPRLMSQPAVVGDPRVGATVSCDGSFAGAAALSYAWYRSGRPVGGSDQRRTLTAADLGYDVSCRLLATGAGGTSVSTSPRRPVAVGLAPTSSRAPSVRGRPRVGVRLTARPGLWAPSPATFTFRWRRDGHPIVAATTDHYRLRPRDRHHRISVVVTARVPGHLAGNAVALAGRIR